MNKHTGSWVDRLGAKPANAAQAGAESDSQKNFHSLLRDARESEGYSRTQMAGELPGVTPDQLKDYETTNNLPSAYTFGQMREGLSCLPGGARLYAQLLNALVQAHMTRHPAIAENPFGKQGRYLPHEFYAQVLWRTNNPDAWQHIPNKPDWMQHVPTAATPGEYLCAYRRALGISDSVVAKAIRCNQSSISLMETSTQPLVLVRAEAEQYCIAQEARARERGKLPQDWPPLYSKETFANLCAQARQPALSRPKTSHGTQQATRS